ncbi:MAG: sulfocyanin-like copper-binding protein [Sulfobacillus sp.]
MRLRLVIPLLAALAVVAGCGSAATYEVGQQYYPPAPPSSSSTPATSPATSTPAASSSTSGSGTSGAATASSPLAKYLTVSTASKTVTLSLIAGLKSSPSPFNFDGTLNGQMVVSVPTGWTLTVKLQNQGVLPHSAAVVKNSTSVTPVTASAATANATSGIGTPPGSSATFSWKAGAAGTYAIACLIPGHETAGMWITLKVLPSGSPAISG